MTWPPAASIRAAAAITSITMNGGTLLRRDAVSRLLARSLSVASSIDICYLTQCPRLAAFHGLVRHISYPARRQSFKDHHHVAPHRATHKDLETDRGRRRARARRCADIIGAGGAGKRPAGDPGYRCRAIAARIHTADAAPRRPGKAEHRDREH